MANSILYFGGGRISEDTTDIPSGKGNISRALAKNPVTHGSMMKSCPRSCWSSARP